MHSNNGIHGNYGHNTPPVNFPAGAYAPRTPQGNPAYPGASASHSLPPVPHAVYYRSPYAAAPTSHPMQASSASAHPEYAFYPAAPQAPAGHSHHSHYSQQSRHHHAAPIAAAPVGYSQSQSVAHTHGIGQAAGNSAADAMSAYLRAHEGQFNYEFGNYPHTEDWHRKAGFRKAIGNLPCKKGKDSTVLNCWGLVFYAQYQAGVLDKHQLRQRTADNRTQNRHLKGNDYTRATGHNLRRDLVAHAPLYEARHFNFNNVPEGSTVLFLQKHANGEILPSHAAVMLDHGQMGHLIQATASSFALSRPAIAHGKLEITDPHAVAQVAHEMMGHGSTLLVAHTNGPQSFVGENLGH
ncbi:hypothetical protein [Janthinobacterium agaricidamnosum]|uniref:Uncharacterized protein n=1 Tax=Janthinobacterium agaricidamnosum NBRC 102515 = DSM 9628 TaxID=1349767 RepID=W0V4L3_9BURK|nr:hypothetical protein [Janthinobacterium agaricidamnosum]CDG82520.1 hypothetical protein GJA_1884 [Janthinobacterium agaricidamnosum NBRC 102515 = DSM 9628]